jgi:hypothetical protein
LIFCISFQQSIATAHKTMSLNPFKPSDNYMHLLFQQSVILRFAHQCIYRFHVILRVNSDYFPEQL